jgi:GAF domain-containing protein
MAVEGAPSNADLQQENARLKAELLAAQQREAESQARETATGEILRVIATSPADLPSVLETIAERAMRLCSASGAAVFVVDGEVLQNVTSRGTFHGSYRTSAEYRALERPISRDWVTGRAVVDRAVVLVEDIIPLLDTEFPHTRRFLQLHRHRTMLAVPLLRDGSPLGVLTLGQLEVRPFTDQQIDLVKTFADQAVIAIENTRLFTELQERNRDLTEALEQQTATGDILRVIASSPTDLQQVLDTVVESAARLCEADWAALFRADASVASKVPGAMVHVVATSRPDFAFAMPLDRTSVNGTALLDGRTVRSWEPRPEHLAKYPSSQADRFGVAAQVVTPLLGKAGAIGTLAVYRGERRAFSERQITLLETFADQAVIAIENTRLFRDLQEALERQTATADILRVIASSPTDVQSVLATIAQSALRLTRSDYALVVREEPDGLRPWAVAGAPRTDFVGEVWPIDRSSVTGRAFVDGHTIHVHDLAAESDDEYSYGKLLQRRGQQRTVLSTPLLREGHPIGAINIARLACRPYTENQIKLIETFADQAVIAIENTRLFQELQDRVEELQALGEVGQTVSSTLDLQQVLSTVVSHADELSGTDGGVLYEYDEPSQEFRLRATRQFGPEIIEALQAAPIRLGEGAVGQAAVARAPVQIPDITAGGGGRPPGRAGGPAAAGGPHPGRAGGRPQDTGRLSAERRGAGPDLRQPVGPGDPERPPVPGDRGQEPAASTGQPA